MAGSEQQIKERLPSETRYTEDITRTRHVQDMMRKAIREGVRFLPGYRLPSLRELAQEYGTSHSTVNEAVRQLEQEGWVKRYRRSGLRVSRILPSWAVKFLLYDEPRFWPLSIFETLVCNGLEKALSANGYHLVLQELSEQADGSEKDSSGSGAIKKLVEEARLGMLSGIVISGAPEELPSVAENMEKLGKVSALPIVRIDHNKSYWGEACVLHDTDAAMAMQVKHLAAAGCRNIALYTPCARSLTVPREGDISNFRSELTKAGLKVSDRHIVRETIEDDARAKYGPWVYEHFFFETFKAHWSRWQAENNVPDGLISTDDIASRSIASVLLLKGVKVPEDLRVITYANKDSGIYYPLPFVQCQIDRGRLGEEAAKLLLKQIDGEQSIVRHARVLVEPRLLLQSDWEASSEQQGRADKPG